MTRVLKCSLNKFLWDYRFMAGEIVEHDTFEDFRL